MSASSVVVYLRAPDGNAYGRVTLQDGDRDGTNKSVNGLTFDEVVAQVKAALPAVEESAVVAEPAAADEMPLRGDVKAAWVDYAVSQGMDRDEAEASTKDDLVERYG